MVVWPVERMLLDLDCFAAVSVAFGNRMKSCTLLITLHYSGQQVAEPDTMATEFVWLPSERTPDTMATEFVWTPKQAQPDTMATEFLWVPKHVS